MDERRASDALYKPRFLDQVEPLSSVKWLRIVILPQMLDGPPNRVDFFKQVAICWPDNQGHAVGKFLSGTSSGRNGQSIQAAGVLMYSIHPIRQRPRCHVEGQNTTETVRSDPWEILNRPTNLRALSTLVS